MKPKEHNPSLSRTALFGNLPLELRELIYQYVVPLPSTDISPPRLLISAADVISGSHSYCPPWLPPIASVSLEIRTDVTLYMFRQVEIYIPYHQTLRHFNRFLATLPAAQGQHAIRRLNLPSFGAERLARERESVLMNFTKSCSQLAVLQIGINAPDLRKTCEPVPQADDCYTNMMLGADVIIETYKLNELTEMTSLVSISFELCPLFNRKPVNGCVAEMIKTAALLQQLFADCGRDVEVSVVDFRGKQWSCDA